MLVLYAHLLLPMKSDFLFGEIRAFIMHIIRNRNGYIRNLFNVMINKIKNKELRHMALPFDYLDSMAWSIVASAVLVGIAAIRLPFKASEDTVEDKGKHLRMGLAIALGASGLYLFITGLAISITWPFPASGGAYNILFGGAASLGGLVILATSVTLAINGSLKAVSYFAVVVGLYLVVDAYAMMNYGLTQAATRWLAASSYAAAALASFLSVPATHSDNKYLRWLFAVFAFLFALAWLAEASNFTWAHLAPPPPAA
jgi:uncharacterized membrane protein